MPEKIAAQFVNAGQVLRRMGKIRSGISDTRLLLKGASAFALREALMMFRKEGEYAGHPHWKPFTQNTLHPQRRGGGHYPLFNIRYGTDMSGKKPKRPPRAKVRRYSDSSKLLQASGQFRNSFTIWPRGKMVSEVGTRHRLAKHIMKGRPVMPDFTEQQRGWLRRLLRRWMADKLEVRGG